jgi:hypothetical protein
MCVWSRATTQRLVLLLVAPVWFVASLSADRLLLRNGREVRGRVVSVSGDIVEFEDARNGRIQRLDRHEVRRIEFDDEYADADPYGRAFDPAGDASSGPPAGMREQQVLAYANVPWSDTGINVRAGQTLYFRARGEVRWGKDREDGPQGEKNSPHNANRPIPGRPGAALIGKVGEGAGNVFFIGDHQGPIRMRTSGRLYLGINDDVLQDNRGFFTIVVSH